MSSKGQIYQVMPQFGYKFNRVAVDSALHIPSFCGVPNITDYIKNGMLAIDTCNNTLFQWTRANGWTPISTGTYLDTNSLSNRINQRVKYTDTSAMLLPYLKKIDTTAMLSRYLRKSDTASLSNRINLKLSISDTSTMLSKYLRIFDTTSMLSKYLRRNDTTAMLSPYARKSITITPTAPLTGGGDLSANRTISISQATSSVSGYLNSTDFTYFNAKVDPTTGVFTTLPLQGGGNFFTNRTLSIRKASATDSGYLSATDWNTFNSKLSTSDTTAMLSKYVPYIGANKDVNLGNYKLSTSATQFSLSSQPSYSQGLIWYDSTQKSLAFYNDASYSPVYIGENIVFKVYNNTGSTISKGAAVYIKSGGSFTYPNVELAKADSLSTSAVIGLMNGSTPSGSFGYVTSTGVITGVNTGAYSEGTILYLSPYASGQLMNTVPPTGYAVQVGVVAHSNTPNGTIYIKQTTPLAISASTIVGGLTTSQGGTGSTSSLNQGGIVYGSTTNTMSTTSAGTTGKVLTSNGTSAPTWTNKVDTIYRTLGKDSIIFTIGSTRYAIKDSIGSGGGGGTPSGSNGYVQFNNSSSFGGDSSLFWNNTNKRLGVGTTTPSTKLDVVSGTKSTMPYNYEMAAFSRNGEAKLGVYNTDNYANGTGASITLGNSKNVNFNGTYPGFEFQNINDSANWVDSYSRYNYLERNTSGTVVGANVDLFKIYADGRVVMTPTSYGLSAFPRLIVGSDLGETFNVDGTAYISNNFYLDGNLLMNGGSTKYIDASNVTLYTGKLNRHVTPMHSTTTTTYNVQDYDHVLFMYPDDANMTVFLPQADEPGQEGRELIIKQVGNIGTYTVTVNGDGFNIDGNSSVVIAASGAAVSLTIICADYQWHIINGNIE